MIYEPLLTEPLLTVTAFVSLTVNALMLPFFSPVVRGSDCNGGYAQMIGSERAYVVFITGEYPFTYFSLRGDRPLVGLSPQGIWIKGDR